MAINIDDMTIHTCNYLITFDTLLHPHITSKNSGVVRICDKVLFSKETDVFWKPLGISDARYLEMYDEDNSCLTDTVNAFRLASELTLFEEDNLVTYFYDSYDGIWIPEDFGKFSGRPLYLTYVNKENSGEVLWAVVNSPQSTDYAYLRSIDGTPINENYTGFSATLDNDMFLSIL